MLLVAKKFYNKAGLNPSIIFNIITRLVQSATGILALLLITRYLDKTEQGYYYTFTSFLAIQIFFELGLTGIITQYIAHEAAHLTWINKHQLSGENYYKSRLASILHLSLKWFLFLAVIMFLVLFFAGNLFFSHFNAELSINWQLPWITLTISTSFLLMVNLFLAILEGLGKVEETNKLRFFQHLLILIFLILFFSTNFKLLSSGLAYLASNLIICFIISSRYKKVLINIWNTDIQDRINFREEILPFLIKIGLGSISGYFIWQIINPVLFATKGPILAGQMGATQTFLNGVLVISLSWLSTKVTLFSNLVSRARFRQLNMVYQKNLTISGIVCFLGLFILIVLIWLFKNYYPELGDRFLDITPIIFLGLTQLVSLVGNAQAYYLRSFKQEPFFIPSLVIGILSGVSTVLCSLYLGITALTFVYFIINGVIGLIWVCIIFRNKTLEWTNTRLYI